MYLLPALMYKVKQYNIAPTQTLYIRILYIPATNTDYFPTQH